MTTTLPAQYFDRFDETKNYDRHLFIAGRGLQSAELNEIQSQAASRLRGVADALFKDGDIVRDASCIVDADTGVVRCQSGAIYIRGAVRGVAPATFTIPIVGTVAIGIRLLESVVTALEDTDLLDPATGTRNYNEPGAERLEIVAVWGWDGDAVDGEFFPVYTVVNGVLNAKEPPPALDSIMQALARYDRDSAGGTYIVSGLLVSKLPDESGVQYYSLSEGRARVYGYGVEFSTSRRVDHAAIPDLLHITNEPHLSTTSSAQRINFDRSPGTTISELTITAQKTVPLTHGVFTGAIDPLPDTSILSIISVVQGPTTYVQGTDYKLTAGQVDWSLTGAEVAPGSTYDVTYRYLANVTPTLIDDDGFTVTGAVSGTNILVSYSQKLPRYDRLCANQDGEIIWLTGVASAFNPLPPSVPSNLLLIATIYQNWRATRTVSNDGTFMVPMTALAKVERRLDEITQLVAQNRLESNIHTREAGTKKGLFTDPFIDDSQRDAGTVQTAAIVGGELVLPIVGTPNTPSTDITAPASLPHTNSVALEQKLRSGGMKINPYMAFEPPPAKMTVTPAVDRWQVDSTVWASPTTGFWSDAPNGEETAQVRQLSVDTIAIKTLRSISVDLKMEGFIPGETLTSLTFDGVPVTLSSTVANGSGVIHGTFTIPAGIPAGTKSIAAVGSSGTKSSGVFVGQGVIEQRTMQVVRMRVATMAARTDPLAQTFTLTDAIQTTGVELWFTVAPTTEAIVQIRETATGFPTQTIIAEGRVAPGGVTVGGTTLISFANPVYLMAGVEYAIVVLCNDASGSVAVAELGKIDSATSRWITGQPYTIGVLLSSSNASTWTAHQDRDLAFRLMSADYTATSATVSLGTVSVTGATDLAVLANSDVPTAQTRVDYTLTLPGGEVLTLAEGQRTHLTAAITGNIGVAASLKGTADFSPVLYQGTQIVSGILQATGDYVTRAVPAGTGVKIKVIYEGVVPSGATVDCYYKGPDAGDTWQPISVLSTAPVDDGFVEFVRQVTPITEASVQIKLVLSGTPAARPRIRDLRVIVLENL